MVEINSHSEDNTFPRRKGVQRFSLSTIIRMIEENGGTYGLDLSNQDLSWIDLSQEAVQEYLRSKVPLKTRRLPPIWLSAKRKGLNLSGANLEGTNLEQSNLHGVDFTGVKAYRVRLLGANLEESILTMSDCREVDMRFVDLRGSVCFATNFEGSCLRGAKFDNASLQKANLTDTNLELVSLLGADLQDAVLRKAILFDIKLSGSNLSRKSLGEEFRINKDHYAESPWYEILTTKERQKLQARTLTDLQELFRELKNSFQTSAHYGDTSWAHFNQRRLERLILNPLRIHKYYPNLSFAKKNLGSFDWWKARLKYLWQWFIVLVAEASCGFGERPLRTIVLSSIIVFFFSWLYHISKGIIPSSGMEMSWLDYISYSVGTFTTMSFNNLTAATTLAQFLTSLEAALGIAMFALLMFTLGNLINR